MNINKNNKTLINVSENHQNSNKCFIYMSKLNIQMSTVSPLRGGGYTNPRNFPLKKKTFIYYI